MIDLLKSKFTFKRVLSLLVVAASLLWLSIFSFPDQKLHLIFCDVGQGDATLITKGFDQILIDGGPNDKVLQCLSNNMPFFDRTIEMVALTHPEADHMTGLISVLDKYKVEYFLSGPEGNESAAFLALKTKILSSSNQPLTSLNKPIDNGIKSITGKGTQVINPYTGEKIRLGEIELETLWPDRNWVASRIVDDYSSLSSSNHPLTSFNLEGTVLGAKTSYAKLNDFSLVFLLNYGGKKVLLMGDADSKIQDEIIEVNSLTEIDILKFPHHGSKTGILESFLEKIQPKETIISVGKNPYGHPTKEALELLTKYGIKIRRTDLEGEIHYAF